MINNQSKESIGIFDSLIDPENAEELKRTKTDIETNITKIQNLIKSENQGEKDGSPRYSRKEAELMGLTEDLYKQYQSLYAQYDNVIGKIVSHKINKKSSVSSADSESEEFFSSEEVDGSNRRRSTEQEQKYVSDTLKQESGRGDNRDVKDLNQNIGNTNEVLKTEASAEAIESERQLNLLVEEMNSLNNDKTNLELQTESQPNELHDRVMELESLLKEKQGAVSNLEVKLNNSEEQAKSNIVKLMAQFNELVLETKSLRTQKDEMEEKIKYDKNEASTEREELMEKVNVMQQKLDSIGNLNKELEAQIENLNANLAEMKSTEQIMTIEKEDLLARLKDMELELETHRNQNRELEERLKDISYEIKQLMNENKSLQDRNDELKAAMTQRGEEISSFLRENEGDENEASMEIMFLKAEVNELRLELDNLNEQKTKLELQNERNQKEYEESLAKMENLNARLTAQIDDQEKTIKDQLSKIDRINAEQKETIIMSNKFRLSQRTAERKMEELADKVKKKMEDNIRLLHQRIHVAEQLNNENKNSCKLIKIRYEQENKILGEKIAIYEDELERLKGASSEVTHSSVVDLKRFEFEAALNGLDAVAAKFEEQKECVMNNVSKMLSEIQFAKDWIKNMNVEMKQLKDNVDSLTTLLSEKEEQELLLRDKVWNLEATVSKEGGEKLNLTNAVNQLEKKVGKLEKNLKEKDEDLDSLGEKKREAIRQLCLVVEFHRDRCNYLMNMVKNMRVNKKT